MPPFRDNDVHIEYANVAKDPLVKNRDFSYFIEKNIKNTRYIFVDENHYGVVIANVIAFFLLHIVYFGGVIHVFRNGMWGPYIFGFFYGFLSLAGVTIGAHRLWSHRAYKAKLPLRILLMIMHTMAGQNDLYTWCRDHRLHHRYTETDADPHNSNRGFFFTHVGWLLTKKHPDVILKGKTVDCSDLLKDPVVRFQRKHYVLMYIIFCFGLPTSLCRYYFQHSWLDSFVVGCFGRYIISLHLTWFVNSAAHMFGDRPYNPKIGARENVLVQFAAWGSEGFHNYHHVFPWDYTISEMGWSWNPMKNIIDMFAKFGLAYDLRRPTPELIAKIKQNALRQKDYVHPYDEPHSYY